MNDLEQQINEIKSSTILSSYDDKLTLLQWLKKLEQAIKESNIKFLDYVKINEFNNKIQIEMSFDGLKVYSNAIDVLSQTDDAVTENSVLPVQSGAVYTSLKNAVDSIMVDINNINGNINNINGNINNINGDIGNINDDINNINTILPLDNTPTANSTKGVTSGGVYTALENAGITPRYEHNIYARVLNNDSSTIGYIYYKIINTQASKFAFTTPVFETIDNVSTMTENILCTGLVKLASSEYILTNFEKSYAPNPYLFIEGVTYNGTNFYHDTALSFSGNGTIQTGGVLKVEVVNDYVITL